MDKLDHENEQDLVQPCLIVSEGKGDAAFFRHILDVNNIQGFQIGFPSSVTAQGHTGKDGFGYYLEGLRAKPGFDNLQHVIIARDSDDSPVSAFGEVRSQVENVGKYDVPAKPNERAGRNPSVTILLVPGEGEKGNLETLLLKAVATHATLSPCLKSYFDCCKFDALPVGTASKKKTTTIIAAWNDKNPSCTLANIWSEEQAKGNPFIINHPAIDAIAEFLRQYLA